MDSSFLGYIENYRVILRNKGLKDSTIKQYLSDLGEFFHWVANYKDSFDINTLRSLTGQDLEAYVKHLSDKGVSDATFRRLLSVLNQFLKSHRVNTSTIINQSKDRPLRALDQHDFISDEEMGELLLSMSKSNRSAARDYLIERNLAIVFLARFYGFTPRDISSITMDKINLAQKTIEVRTGTVYEIAEEHIHYIRVYRNTIEKTIRPRLRSKDPLFVSFINRSCSFQFDYHAAKPRGLSIRGIQEMIKDEVRLAGLRKISVKHLRNTCILDQLSSNKPIESVVSYFRLSDSFSVRRYVGYLKTLKDN